MRLAGERRIERERFRDHFLARGVEHYIAGRLAVQGQMSIVAGNALHHAIEMLLKAHLVRTIAPTTLSTKEYGHHLPRLWFKFRDGVHALSVHDRAIGRLQKFEWLRYPNRLVKEGANITAGWGPWQRPNRGGRIRVGGTGTRYELAVGDVDDVVIAILDHSSVNPGFFTPHKREAFDALVYQNAHAARWRP